MTFIWENTTMKQSRKRLSVSILTTNLLRKPEIIISLCRVTENALNNILNKIKPQNNHFSLGEDTLSPKRQSLMVGRTGFEPATFCTSSRCPNRTRRPAHSQFRMFFWYLSFSFLKYSIRIKLITKHEFFLP